MQLPFSYLQLLWVANENITAGCSWDPFFNGSIPTLPSKVTWLIAANIYIYICTLKYKLIKINIQKTYLKIKQINDTKNITF